MCTNAASPNMIGPRSASDGAPANAAIASSPTMRAAEPEAAQTRQARKGGKSARRHPRADAAAQHFQGDSLRERDEPVVARNRILAVEVTQRRDARDLAEDLVGRERAMEVQLFERRHAGKMRHAPRGVVRAAEHRHVQVERKDASQCAEGGQRPIGERSRAAHGQKRVGESWHRQRRELAQLLRTVVGEPGAEDDARQGGLPGQRRNRAVTGRRPLQVDLLQRLMGLQMRHAAIADAAAARERDRRQRRHRGEKRQIVIRRDRPGPRDRDDAASLHRSDARGCRGRPTTSA